METLLDRARQADRTVMRDACVGRARFPSIDASVESRSVFAHGGNERAPNRSRAPDTGADSRVR